MTYWAAVVDDDPLNLKAAERILGLQGYKVSCMSSGEELLKFVKENIPDIILLDVHMEGLDGFATFDRLKAKKKTRQIPVIFLTADDDEDTETRALAEGARDFVTKPITPSVLLMRVRNTIELTRLQADLMQEVSRVTAEIQREHERNERLSLQIVQTLAGTIDAKDAYTKGHSSRVADYSRMIAKRAGYPQKELEDIYIMGLLHDVGKIGVPDSVINKPSRLTEEEYELIKAHPMVGYEILKNISEMPKLAVGARWHHERWDGTGYPDGLKGTDIPLEARIIAVADAYDAMSSRRSYHGIYAQQYIIDELKRCSGSQFDPTFAQIMLSIIDEDKSYNLREEYIDDTGSVQAAPEETKDDRKFSYLTMLDVGGVNTAIGLKYCMNDVDIYSEMLSEFASNADERVEKLEKGFNTLNLDSYRNAAHSLKSAARTIGAERLSDLAALLEDAAKNGNHDIVAMHHAELVALLQATVSGILMAQGMIEE